MVDDDGGIHIQMQPPLVIGCRTRCPRLRPGMGSSGPNPRQMGGVDALIDQPPQRGSRANSTKDVLAIPPSTQSAPSATAATRSANTAPGAWVHGPP